VPWEAKGDERQHIGVEAAMQLLGQGEVITVTGAQWAAKAGYKNPRTVRRWMNEGRLAKDPTGRTAPLLLQRNVADTVVSLGARQWPRPNQIAEQLLWTPPATSLTPSTKLTKKSSPT
jgi:hypothetical protein